jgi:hypothetical protein
MADLNQFFGCSRFHPHLAKPVVDVTFFLAIHEEKA